MDTSEIEINASRRYTVYVGHSLSEVGALASGLCGGRSAAVISDDGVFPLWGQSVCDSLTAAGWRVLSYVLPAGEASKGLSCYGTLMNFLCKNRLGRDDLILALGGGMVGDIAAFAAATYLRGIACIQLPTTLLAMVDSSVGGKCALNLDGYKNQIGVFTQPAAVLCDTAVLATLPETQYRSGCAEIIKYALLEGSNFPTLLKTPVRSQYETVIARCVDIKRRYVAEDEFDRGIRRYLNFGHSIGHALEALEAGRLSHGEAVAIGMAAVTRAAAKRGICTPDTLQTLENLLTLYGLPNAAAQPAEDLAAAMLHDKKILNHHLNLIVPEALGRFRTESVDIDALPQWLRDGGIL